MISAEYLSIDETGEDFQSFLEDVRADENLKCVTRTGYGFSSMLHNSVLNLPIGGDSYIFNSVEDMEAVLSQSMSFSTYQQEDIYFTSQNLV
ncbi:MAG: hypothetical protein E7258_05320 [Lachnospiraceae bacterium]|nr:hypothetical protein [Lachnospiraceae bacterium]